MMFPSPILSAMALAGLIFLPVSTWAQSVVTGGATEPQALYEVILPADGVQFSYVGTGSGAAKNAVLNNNGALFGHPGRSVPMAASDLRITPAEDAAYTVAHITSPATPADQWGPVLQMPAYVMAVGIPFNKANVSGIPEALNFRRVATSLAPDVLDLCGIFSGRITAWTQIAGSNRTGPITVLYRADHSGTSVLLGNYLNAACSGSTEINLTGGAYDVDQSSFAAQFPGGAVPANFLAVAGSDAMDAAVVSTQGAVGYASVDTLGPLVSDTSRVAQVAGASATAVNIVAAASSLAPPIGSAGGLTRAAWMPNFGNPASGYPIVGFSSLVVSQCFIGADPNGTYNTMMEFLNGLYASSTLPGVAALPAAWRIAAVNTFLNNASGRYMNIQNGSICNLQGKPLL